MAREGDWCKIGVRPRALAGAHSAMGWTSPTAGCRAVYKACELLLPILATC